VGCTGAESIPADDTNAHVNAGTDLTATNGKTDVEAGADVAATNNPIDAYTHCHIGRPSDIDRHDHGNPSYANCHHKDHRYPDVATKLDHRSTHRHRSL
jgi:hypothetical protein